MSIWKSPVFYFGVVLFMVVALALVAPFTINWNAWKSEMETYGRNLTGRDVNISGPVEVRLFPWPRLQASDVRLANADGFGEAPLLSADVVTLRLSLAGLFNGSLEVEEIAFDGPQLNLKRNAAGNMNWVLSPIREFAGLVSRVKLDRITVKDGSIWFEDTLHNQSTSLTGINASVSADALAGPWRMQGAGQWRDIPSAISFSLGEIEKGKPLRVAASVKPQDLEVPSLAIEGDWGADEFKGKVRAIAQEPEGEKTSLEGAFRPLSLQSDIAWTRDSINLTKIRIAPADTRDSGTLIEGTAEMALSDPPKARVKLESPRINLDAVLGAQSMARWRSGGALELANSIFDGLPEKLAAEFALDVSVLTLGGETLNSVRLRGLADKQAIRIQEATSDLPGRSRLRFDGVAFPSATGAELGGTLSFESYDLRDVSRWIFPAERKDIDAFWQGARGRLKLQTNVNWSATRIALQDTAYELDGQPGKLQAIWRFGEVPVVDAQLEMTDLDLDSYLNAKTNVGFNDVVFGGLAQLPSLLAIGQKAEQRVTVQLKSLRLNGVNASNLALDYEAGLSGLQLKALDIDGLGGAMVKGEGLLTQGADGPLGEFDFKISAKDIRATLQMAGVASQNAPAPWLGVLGATESNINVSIEPDDGRPRVAYRLSATSGETRFSAEGKAIRQPGSVEPAVEAKAQVQMPSLSNLLGLYGLSSAGPTTPLTLDATLSGTRDKGLQATLTATSGSDVVSYSGKLTTNAPYMGVAGELSIVSKSFAELLARTGIPVSQTQKGPLNWSAKLNTKDGELTVEHVAGSAAGGEFDVSATANKDGHWSIEAGIGETALRDVVMAVAMPWRGADSTLSDSYAPFSDKDIQWQAFLRPRSLMTGLASDINEAVIAIESSPTRRAMNIKSPEKTLNLDVVLQPKGSSFTVSGQAEITVDAGTVLRAADGKSLANGMVKLQGSVSATGQSPAAALSAADGKGTYWVENLVLTNVTAQGFAQGIESAKQQVALSNVFEKLMAPPGTEIGARTGAIEMSGGEAKLTPFAAKVDGAQMDLTPEFDLSVPELSVRVAIATAQRADVPPVVVTYSGTPGQISTRVANAALASKLGYELLAQELAALEKLQQEEADVIRRQEQQRKDDDERLAAYQAQRVELRNKVRLLRFHQEERARAKAESERALLNALKTGDAINREELRRSLRLLQIQKDLVAPSLQP
jgi:hypothetical protein